MQETEAYHYPKDNKGKRTGNTLCILVRDGYIFVGEAACSPEDEFSRKVGRKIAKGRAEQRHKNFLSKVKARRDKEMKELLNDLENRAVFAFTEECADQEKCQSKPIRGTP